MKRVLRILAFALCALLLVFILVLIFRDGPLGPLAGGRLGGPEVSDAIDDWSFSDAHETIAVETRPEDPHSVTTVCFQDEGRLFVPALGAAEKQWPAFVLADPRVRLRIGKQIYPARLYRVEDDGTLQRAMAAAVRKYPRLGEGREEGAPPPEGLWVFEARSGH